MTYQQNQEEQRLMVEHMSDDQQNVHHFLNPFDIHSFVVEIPHFSSKITDQNDYNPSFLFSLSFTKSPNRFIPKIITVNIHISFEVVFTNH